MLNYRGFNLWVLLQAQYLIVLCSFKDQLQQHVRVHAVEAVMACREIENTLQALTGLSFLQSPSHILMLIPWKLILNLIDLIRC